MKASELIINGYYFSNAINGNKRNYIFKKNATEDKFEPTICIENNEFNKFGNVSYNNKNFKDFRNCSYDEILWLELCIKENKFVPKPIINNYEIY